MNARRNPSEERLLAYASGSLSAPEAVVIAAHLAMRPANDAWVRELQAVGGAFLNDASPADLSEERWRTPWPGSKRMRARSGRPPR